MSDPRLSAAQRLAASRERLRLSMRKAEPEPRESGGMVADALHDWWSQHPWRVAGTVAADAVKAGLQPVAQRHPIALVLGAVVVGGLIVWARPWRGILRPALLAGLLPQLMSKAMEHLPVESWLAVLSSLAKQPAATKAGSAATASSPQAAPAQDAGKPPQAPLH